VESSDGSEGREGWMGKRRGRDERKVSFRRWGQRVLCRLASEGEGRILAHESASWECAPASVAVWLALSCVPFPDVSSTLTHRTLVGAFGFRRGTGGRVGANDELRLPDTRTIQCAAHAVSKRALNNWERANEESWTGTKRGRRCLEFLNRFIYP
jgi:hypothetical protein